MPTAGSVEVIFQAETSAFVASVKRADDAVGNSSRAMEAASQRLEKAWNKELLAQDRLAEKVQQTARAKELAALKSDILSRAQEQEALAAEKVAATAARESEQLQALARIIDKTAASTRSLAASQEMVAGSGSHQVSSMAASSGALRLLEGNFTNNIRAAERFLGTTLGLGTVLQSAFQYVGAAALIGVFAKLGTEAYKAEQDIVHLKGAIEALDQMSITVDKRNSAAGDSIEEQVERILEKTQGKTASLQQKYGYESQKPVDLSSYFYDDGFKKLPNDVKANYESTYKSIAPADLPARLAKIRGEVTDLQKALASTGNAFGVVKSVGGFGPNSDRTPADYYKARLTAASQIQSQLQSQSDLRGAQGQGLQQDITDEQQHQRDEAQRKSEEAARKGAAAFRQAGESQRKSMQEQLADMKIDHSVALDEELKFWQGMEAAASHYPDNLRAIKEREGAIYQEMDRQLETLLRGYDEKNKRAAAAAAESIKRWDETAQRLSDEMAKQEHRGADYLAEQAAGVTHNASAMSELVTAHEVATGAITKHDAAIMAATAHAADYQAQLDAIAQQRQNDANDSSLTPEQRDANEQKYTVRQTAIQGEADRSAVTDQWAVNQQTAVGGFLSALQEMTAAQKDTAAQMRSLTTSLVSDVNKTLVEELTSRSRQGPRHLWTNIGHDLAVKGTASAVRFGESSIFEHVSALVSKIASSSAAVKASGLGKDNPIFRSLGIGGKKTPTGSQDDPLHVIMAGSGPGNAGSSVLSSLGVGRKGGETSGLGGLLQTVMPFVPGFADGVSGFGGGWAMVGERGPELLKLPGGSNVVPNHKMGGYMGDGGAAGETHLHFDLRGNTDPAQAEAAMHRIVMQHSHGIAVMAHAYGKDQSRRSVGGGR